MVLDQLGVSSVWHMALYDARRCVLRSLVRTTATVVVKSKFGLSTALELSSYSYRFWNWCGTTGFAGGGRFSKELYWCNFRNWMHF